MADVRTALERLDVFVKDEYASRCGCHDVQEMNKLDAYINRAWQATQDVIAIRTAIVRPGDEIIRDGDADDLLFRAWSAILVLRALLTSARLAGADIAADLIKDIEALHPEFTAMNEARLVDARAKSIGRAHD